VVLAVAGPHQGKGAGHNVQMLDPKLPTQHLRVPVFQTDALQHESELALLLVLALLCANPFALPFEPFELPFQIQHFRPFDARELLTLGSGRDRDKKTWPFPPTSSLHCALFFTELTFTQLSNPNVMRYSCSSKELQTAVCGGERKKKSRKRGLSNHEGNATLLSSFSFSLRPQGCLLERKKSELPRYSRSNFKILEMASSTFRQTRSKPRRQKKRSGGTPPSQCANAHAVSDA
jgi:hypothetical protein